MCESPSPVIWGAGIYGPTALHTKPASLGKSSCMSKPPLARCGGRFFILKFILESFGGNMILIFFHDNLKSQHFMGKPLP
jgi:hypothetical protein